MEATIENVRARKLSQEHCLHHHELNRLVSLLPAEHSADLIVPAGFNAEPIQADEFRLCDICESCPIRM
jgi:hypothetical protein